MPDDAPPGRPLPLFGERALHIPDERTVVVGDVHVGLETHLRRKGVHLPSQTMRMRAKLEALILQTDARRLVVVGDLKHKVPYSTRQEIVELPALFRDFPAEVELVRGNHDVDLEGRTSLRIHDAAGIRVGDVGLTHGHVWPADEVMAARTVVTCHNHPAVLLVDKLGHRHKEPCWVRAGFTDAARAQYPGLPADAALVVMPAFNPLTGGTAFNAEEGARLMGPLFAQGLVDVDNAHAFTLDGVDLGTIASLRQYGQEPKRGRGRRGRRQGASDKGADAPDATDV